MVDPFQLTDDAIVDIDAIWLYLLQRSGVATEDRVVTELFKGFDRLAEIPNCGHRRPDLTTQKVLFYRVFSYLIIYAPEPQPLQILGVLHGKRNVSRILRRLQ
jgi:toxin ParE1/3/4